MTASREQEQRAAAEQAGQGHVFRFWDQLDEGARERLLDQLEAVDYELVAELAQLIEHDPASAHAPTEFAPPEVFPLHRDEELEQRAREAVELGREALSAGRIGYLLVAGGQASRLGYDGPKGAFPLGPVSGRSLFGYHAHRLRAAAQRYEVSVPWYVMTSPANHETTRQFFEQHDWFGLDPNEVFLFSQEMLPALDTSGRILLAAPDQLFLAPNGHGGVLSGLARSGALADAAARGIETFSFFQVDNPLVRPADPLFLGLHLAAGAGMSSKIVAKRDPGEKVGVLGLVDGRMGCIEYSDLPPNLREARTQHGELLFNAGNIAVHAIQRSFVEELTLGRLQLPWHLARKSMKVVDHSGQPVERDGVKFETFVFDALGKSESSVTLEVDRALEFSPVKNKEGGDSPESSRRDLSHLFGQFVLAKGLKLPARGWVEIDPLLAETEEEFLASDATTARELDDGHVYEVSVDATEGVA